jgi:phospholipid/cholesterol/gamma-HCH transport system substrate-binding protein
MADSLKATAGNLDSLTGKLNRGEGSAAKLVNDATLYDRLTSVTTQLDQLAGGLNAGEGTAGQILRNKQLYENMNGAVNDLRTLIADIRKDPKKYLNVKVSVF